MVCLLKAKLASHGYFLADKMIPLMQEIGLHQHQFQSNRLKYESIALKGRTIVSLWRFVARFCAGYLRKGRVLTTSLEMNS